MDRIAARPQAEWLNGPNPGPVVRARTTAAARADRTAVLVAYYIPNRDCGQYSLGGAPTDAAYLAWIDEFATALGDRGAYVIVEPDAVAQVVAGCTRVTASDRYALLAHAVDRLKRQPHTRVYVDAGNSSWIPEAGRLVAALKASGVARADGVALNVSNFQTNQASSTYGDQLSKDLVKPSTTSSTPAATATAPSPAPTPGAIRPAAPWAPRRRPAPTIPPRRLPVDQTPRRVRRHLPGRPGRRPVVAVVRPGTGPQRPPLTYDLGSHTYRTSGSRSSFVLPSVNSTATKPWRS